MAAGLLVIPSGERVIRFLPPLNVDSREIDEAVQKFAAVLKGVSRAS
jgi:acetylornithine/succinyldiaminopimelate/putrescine aminotransferase